MSHSHSNHIGAVADAKPKERVIRPWDKKRLQHQASQQRYKELVQQAEREYTQVSYVEDIHGERFYSDRFYLNRSLHDDTQTNDNKQPSNCACGAHQPPPLLDRSALVANLDLKAAIVATYTLQKRCLWHEFPQLFGPDATIPTLVLHGRKTAATRATVSGRGAKQHIHEEEDTDDDNDSHLEPPKEDENDFKCPSVDDEAEEEDDDDDSDDDDMSLQTQPQDEDGAKQESTTTSPLPRSPLAVDTHHGSPPTTPRRFSPHVSFTEVTPSWIAPVDLPTKIVNKEGNVSETIVQKRRYRPGVHHPKYMILFETSGSIVVMVSTANLVSQRSTDGTWVQRFQPLHTDKNNKNDASIFGNLVNAGVHSGLLGQESCPGRVLGHFLDCQTWACAPGQLTPLGFLQQQFCWTTQSCQELAFSYDWGKSQVFLVPVVPGDHTAEPNKKKDSMFRYGRQFVAHVLERLEGRQQCLTGGGPNDRCRSQTQIKPWLPPILLSPHDRLVFQPTSLGGEWRPDTLRKVVASYLGRSNHDDAEATDSDDDEEEEDILARLDIVWPTDDFMKAIRLCQKEDSRQIRSKSPNSVIVETGFQQQQQRSKKRGRNNHNNELIPEQKRHNHGYLFLTSETFNSIHPDCLARLVMFEPSTPPQQPQVLVPHFKSVARRFDGKRYRIQKDHGIPKSTEVFSWFLLTSACLSRGAQGVDKASKNQVHNTVVSYGNFELGVLLCSRLQGKPQTDRVYGFKPAFCSCQCVTTDGEGTGNVQNNNSLSEQPRQRSPLIHLPIPFDLRPSGYLEDEENDMAFCETPYFNEIQHGSANSGNMKYTPLGLSVAQHQQDEEQNRRHRKAKRASG